MGNVTSFKQLEKLLLKNGWVIIRSNGSHFVFAKEGFQACCCSTT